MRPLVVFSHGKESGPRGGKIEYLSRLAEQHGCRVLSIDYTDLADPDERVKRLVSIDFGEHSRLILAGSSMGGYVSALASKTLSPAGLFLMAPAFYLPGYQEQRPKAKAGHTLVVFGWEDEVIPVEHAVRFSREMKAELHIFDSTHRLLDVLPEVGSLFQLFLKKCLA